MVNLSITRRLGIWGCITGLLALAACGETAGLTEMRLAGQFNPPEIASDRWVIVHSCVNRMDNAVFGWSYYKRLLTLLKEDRYVVVPLRELKKARAEHPDKVVVGMRHDIDGNVCKAGRMARIEKVAGIQSSYYVRHTDAYYSWGWPLAARRGKSAWRYRDLQDLGHEVGLHIDVLSMAVEYGFDQTELLANELLFLRNHGLTISGVSAHGSVSASRYRYSNYELFAGMTTRETIEHNSESTALGMLALDDFSLDYEAYHLGYEHYFSDAGGHWSKNPFEELPKVKTGEAAVILTHPIWWGTEDDKLEYY